MMALNYDNTYCQIAADMLSSSPGLLDYRLVEYLNEINQLVQHTGGEFKSRQTIALAIVSWKRDLADDFTKQKKAF